MRWAILSIAATLLWGGSVALADHGGEPFHISVTPNPATTDDPVVVTVSDDGNGFCSSLSDPIVDDEARTVWIEITVRCPPPPATSYPAHFMLGTLPPGIWDVRLIDGDPPIAPPPVYPSISLTVTDPRFAIELVPSPATEDDEVIAMVAAEASCPWIRPPEIEEGLIRLRLSEAGICDPPPPIEPFDYEQSLGMLAAGEYQVELIYGYNDLRVAESSLSVLPSNACVPGETTLCLNQGRFRAEATWSLPSGLTRPAQAVELTDGSGAFWFLDPNQVELLVRVIDACTWFRPSYWVFAGGATNLGVTIEVTDTQTGESRIYENPVGEPFETVLNTAAFLDCP